MSRIVLWSAALIVMAAGCGALYYTRATAVIPDAAKAAGRAAQDFTETDSSAFAEMDGGIPLSAEETRGRNTWLLWTAGDETFWDTMARQGMGTGDLLKAIDSRLRSTRFREAGMINQPCFKSASAPDGFGLWIDQGPQEQGVDPKVYGRPTGIVGLRLYPNPKFNQAAAARWNGDRYYSDRGYYEQTTLVRPYVIGMTCGFCHVAFNPERPPADAENPRWSELASAPGNQYLRASRVFGAAASADSFALQVLQSWPPGTIDTSFIATDHLNNPSSITPIFALAARQTVAHHEDIGPGALHLPGETKRMPVPHVLKDGADSVGIVGALSRVYVSIGEYSEEWLRDFDAYVGLRRQRPFSIERAQKGSVYWQATAGKLGDIALFLMRMKPPALERADGGATYLSHEPGQLDRGKLAFAEHCAGCHSSKQPGKEVERGSPQYLDWMRAEVMRPDFLEGNFASTEARVPVSVVQTNAARALATNATRGHVWEDFSSETYKRLKSAGRIEVRSPWDASPRGFSLPAGGPGYYRVPSLLGIWATAPLLHNNALGRYTGDPSIQGRLAAFDDSMKKLLWPESRGEHGVVWKTSEESYLNLSASSLPWEMRWLAKGGALRVGPIPAGTPVALLASADFELGADRRELNKIGLMLTLQSTLLQRRAGHVDSAQTAQEIQRSYRDILAISKCPDFIEDRGHTFGAEMSDADKHALIEYLKTF